MTPDEKAAREWANQEVRIIRTPIYYSENPTPTELFNQRSEREKAMCEASFLAGIAHGRKAEADTVTPYAIGSLAREAFLAGITSGKREAGREILEKIESWIKELGQGDIITWNGHCHGALWLQRKIIDEVAK